LVDTSRATPVHSPLSAAPAADIVRPRVRGTHRSRCRHCRVASGAPDDIFSFIRISVCNHRCVATAIQLDAHASEKLTHFH
ncbi:hypothetical protein K6W12_20045, partial [Burkholderia multivorans]